ncbi:HAMP domain-containing protein [Desulfoprunum benzoelyticum]|uniref:histidine kinase n=1 Tax=Desulfoprunum benzoelyticum TaxID=1506996 RepID=A0A840V0A1_9BACT|nr:ATP-binding protein [Desulfoprunum benzoelyticum]MBB5348308.1 signal transduction histidine kinase [Desulfoprunum benzoelyticum]MBM9529501.1 HAMP domain-containing protein [Desulfoprunum benzoelyticum]
MSFSNVRIIVRIGLVVGTVFLLMLAVMLVEMKSLATIKRNLDEIVLKSGEQLVLAQDLRFLARNSAVIVRNVLLTKDTGTIEYELERLAADGRRYQECLDRLEALEMEAGGKELLVAVKTDGAVVRDLWRTVIELGGAGDQEKAVAMLLDSVRTLQRRWLDNLSAMADFHKDAASAAVERAGRVFDRTRMVLLVANCLLLLISGLLVAVLTAGIVRPLREFTRTIDSVAGGDLTTRITKVGRDEIGILGAHINTMVEHLQASEKELEQHRFHLEELIDERTGALSDQRKRFTSMLIHDLKGPLVPIIGFSRKLSAQKEIDRDKIVEYAGAIHDSAMKLASTIDHVSADLRGDRLQPNFANGVFDIGGLLESVVESFRPQAEVEHIELGMECRGKDDAGAMPFTGDCARIQTLIENLVGNAVKYARSRVNILLTREDDELILVIEDDGMGIQEQYREQIFDEYFQAPDSKEGSGVGLYSVKKIVDHYHGRIIVGTAAGGGASFTVRLPVARS